MRIEELIAPVGDHEIFETDSDALLIKPYMTGDIFVAIPDGDEEIAVAIAAHPCAIRGANGKLLTRIPCCVLKSTSQPIPYAMWPEGHFDKFPLSDDLGLGPNQAVRLLEWRAVHHRELTRARRRAALTERGVYVFQQRLTHALTRVAVKLDDYERALRDVLREAALEEDWVDGLVADPTDERAIGKAAEAFHRFLDEEETPGRKRRELLKVEGGERRLTKLVRDELKAQESR